MIEQVLNRRKVMRAYRQVVSNKGSAGVDGMPVKKLYKCLTNNMERIEFELRQGKYLPQAILGVEIPKSNGKTRLLGIPTVVDRLLQQAVGQVIAIKFEMEFEDYSYGFRPNRNAQQAVLKAQEYINSGYQHIVDIDLKSFFDEVDHCILLQLLYRKVKCPLTLRLIRKWLRVPILINGKLTKRRKGVPQGSPLSPLLSNIMLNELDKELEKQPAESRDKLRDAFKTAADKRTDEQKMLVASNPNLNINPGVLYQYNAAAAEELKKDDAAIQAKRGEKPIEDFISVLAEPAGANAPTMLFHRGDHRQPKNAVVPADLSIAGPEGHRFMIAEDDPSIPTTGRRLAWARQLTSGTHPLLGRVIANRIWLQHFGRGIVDTPAEFGQLGTRPTNPDLLDWLTSEFPRRGWSSKQLHRVIMTSATYRQTSMRRDSDNSRDADGALYSRFPVRRLEAEIVRDRAIAAAGRLNDAMFGKPLETTEDFAGQVHVKDDVPRRSVYVQDRRSKPVSLLAAFDAPVMSVNCERRPSSTVAPQSLMLMNGDFLLAQAEHMAKHLRATTPHDFQSELTTPFVANFSGHHFAWQYGYGAIETPADGMPADMRLRFAPVPFFNGSAWQGGAVLPDPTLGYVILHAAGGHAGNDQQHVTIRRWSAPRDGVVTITGKLGHPSENGDGVRSRIISSRTGLAGTWEAKNSEIETPATGLVVKSGDTIDFVTDCRENNNSDSFLWRVQVTMAAQGNSAMDRWDSETEFHGPLGVSLVHCAARAWQLVYGRTASSDELLRACEFLNDQTSTLRASGHKGDIEQVALATLCQQLMCSNEFLYVD